MTINTMNLITVKIDVPESHLKTYDVECSNLISLFHSHRQSVL